jgi:predicted Zn-dependent protease
LGIFALIGLTSKAQGPVFPLDPDGIQPAQMQAASTHSEDPVLSALVAEIERSKAQLRMDQVAPPYFIEYRVTDQDEHVAEAAYGAIRMEIRGRRRQLHVVVRIGDYKQDSYFGGGTGVAQEMPLDDNPVVLRHQIWLATDRAYKAAAESLAAKSASLKQLTVEDPVEDFARAPVERHIASTARLDFDAARLRRLLESSSALYRDYGEIESLNAMARFSAVNRYLVNSEGTLSRAGESRYLLTIHGAAQAADGMQLVRSPYTLVATPQELPTSERFLVDAHAMLQLLKALTQAAVIEEEYQGPVLCVTDASNDLFAEVVARNILGNRPPLGRPGRTTGAWANNFRGRVLPEFLTVVDDPTASTHESRSLIGTYTLDDEGVRALPVTVIEKGRLVNYLLGRTPIRDFPVSNGRGRVNQRGQVVPLSSNLFVRSSVTFSRAELKDKMLNLCRERELPYGYLIESFGGIAAPRLIYRVYVKDGRQELVRGAALEQLDARTLRDELIAVGNDSYVSNRSESFRTSVICPSILFRELVIKPANQAKGRLPNYPAPPLTTK